MTARDFQLPVSINKLTWILLGGEWREVKSGTASYVRDACDDLNGWIRFEPADDCTGEVVWVLVSSVTAFQVGT